MHGLHLLYMFVTIAGFVTCRSFHKREINRDTKVGVIGPTVEPHRVHLYRHLVELRSKCSHLCGGVIISPRHVLTAAHCVAEKDPRDLTVTAGITKRFEANGDIRDVFAAIIHNGYRDAALLNDIALLILQEPLDITKYTVAKLPELEADFEGSVVELSGWGHTNDLTYGHFTVRRHPACRAPSKMCVKPFPGIAGFPGDSGSPAVLRKGSDVTLVGIFSGWSYQVPSWNETLFANVGHLRQWIDNSITEGEQLFNIGKKTLSNLPKNGCVDIDDAVRKVI